MAVSYAQGLRFVRENDFFFVLRDSCLQRELRKEFKLPNLLEGDS